MNPMQSPSNVIVIAKVLCSCVSSCLWGWGTNINVSQVSDRKGKAETAFQFFRVSRHDMQDIL